MLSARELDVNQIPQKGTNLGQSSFKLHPWLWPLHGAG